MDRPNSVPQAPQGVYAGGTIGVQPDVQSATPLISQQDKNHTYFCIAMLIILDIASVLFPRSIGASAISYKIREFLLIFAFISFAWTTFKGMKVWNFSPFGKVVVYMLSVLVLVSLTTAMILFHGIEERTDKELKNRPYLQKATTQEK